LATGGDFYNYYVLGLAPASYNSTDYYNCLLEGRTNCGGIADDDGSGSDSSDDNNCTTNLKSWHCLSSAYPDDTLIAEDHLGPLGSGIVTGYMLDAMKTAVLILPSFDGDANTYMNAVEEFFEKAKGARHVIIDLQQNSGGQELLALDLYHRFFPNDFPFTGSRMRATAMANAIGKSFNSAFNTFPTDNPHRDEFLASEWIVTDRINAQTEQQYTSWPEYFGPLPMHDDDFTTTQEYNLTDRYFTYYNLGVAWNDGAFNTSDPKPRGPWAAKDIILVSRFQRSHSSTADGSAVDGWIMLFNLFFLRRAHDTGSCAHSRGWGQPHTWTDASVEW
jgi:hypothetical protein